MGFLCWSFRSLRFAAILTWYSLGIKQFGPCCWKRRWSLVLGSTCSVILIRVDLAPHPLQKYQIIINKSMHLAHWFANRLFSLSKMIGCPPTLWMEWLHMQAVDKTSIFCKDNQQQLAGTTCLELLHLTHIRCASRQLSTQKGMQHKIPVNKNRQQHHI